MSFSSCLWALIMVRFEPGTGMNILKICSVSQSSANQRAGRGGRTEPGKCYRLYSQSDFEAMPRHQEPEIRKIHLGVAVLRILVLGIKNVRDFDFVDAPSPKAIEMATRNLVKLGAVTQRDDDDTYELTAVGLKLVKLGKRRITVVGITISMPNPSRDATRLYWKSKRLWNELNMIVASYWCWHPRVGTEHEEVLQSIILSSLAENVAMYSGYDQVGYEVALTGKCVQLENAQIVIVSEGAECKLERNNNGSYIVKISATATKVVAEMRRPLEQLMKGKIVDHVDITPRLVDPYRLEDCKHVFCRSCLLKQSNGGTYCFIPSPDCPSVYRIADSDRVGAPPFVCGACNVETCTRCHLESHQYFLCETYKLLKYDPDSSLEERSKGKENVKKCLIFSFTMEKVDGCNPIECRCGKHVCWACLQFFDSRNYCYDHLRSVHRSIT
ncbi:hypothetical protein RND71_014877 [Anisodus tanguticus]|uniref:RNA helicase n=1 Tax=Anisodus tanguticus TaxID=243964 RepID=A0AAE1VFF1_9SOLA|nr:hypothetical protein RND71_014877 [Anisodus tanguticus]